MTTIPNEKITAFTGGRILTMDPDRDHAETLVIKNGRILDLGSAEIIQQYPGAEIIDLHGRTLLPGFIDSHNHLSSFGCFFPEWANLIGITDEKALFAGLAEHEKLHPGTGWLVGFGWFDAQCGGREFTRADLDAFCPDRPVVLVQATFHKSVVNSRALEILGIDSSTPDPRCGIIQRNPEGVPTGVLIEEAQVPVFREIMNADTRRHADLIEARGRELLPFGITAVHDPGVTPAAEAAYRLLYDEGRLPVSVLMMPHGAAVLDNDLGPRLAGPVTGTGDEQLRTGPVKLFADGATSETVGFAMKMHGQIIKTGKYRDDFAEALCAAARHGFQTCVHSFGNATTDAVLDAYEQAAKETPAGFVLRPRFEHVALLSDSQIGRLAKMNACVSIQPQFLVRGEGMKRAPLDEGKWFAFGDLSRAGVVVAASSDDPGGFMEARDPIKCSVMGSTMSAGDGRTIFPDQVLPFEEWLRMYTAGGAWAGGQENERGMLKGGLVADLVILAGELDPQNPPVVDETWKDGRIVYRRENTGKTV
ncbi:amidohydrolase [Methanocorpusculum sp.]|uniref:amidohydrolase n=1 Tax=Methanocorpusculum sp. TaxID=2058474 RepID=UPI00272C814B|nr:amidohydrolase [Methanocorpusculum sp.]